MEKKIFTGLSWKLIGKLGGTLDRCLVEQCVQSGDGGALVMLSADAYVRRTILRDNEGRYGGAVYLPANSGGGTLESCLIYRNKASWGGGLYSDATGVSVLVLNCTILDNTQQGTDVYDYGSTRSVMCVNSICTQTGVKSTTKCLTTAAFVKKFSARRICGIRNCSSVRSSVLHQRSPKPKFRFGSSSSGS